MYKISIIVPVYNASKYLDKCVKSLLAQDYQNYEIVLVDDGSTDESGRMCDAYAKQNTSAEVKYDITADAQRSTGKAAQIKVIHKENGGLVSAWKCGAQNATGQYLCFVDSDDWTDANMLSEMAESLTGSTKEIIASDYVIERPGKTPEAKIQRLASGEYDKARLEAEVYDNLLGSEIRLVTLSRCMKLISKELILDNMHFSSEKVKMGEDVTIMLPALLECERLVIMDHRTYYHYLYVDESMVHEYDSRLLEKLELLYESILNIVADKRPALKEMADREYLYLLFLAIKNEAGGNPGGYVKAIKSICSKSENKRLIKELPLEVGTSAGKITYFVMKHPNVFTCFVLRKLLLIHRS